MNGERETEPSLVMYLRNENEIAWSSHSKYMVWIEKVQK